MYKNEPLDNSSSFARTPSRDDLELVASNTFEEPPEETENERPVQQMDEKSKAIPEGGYGWVCVVATFLINMHTWGINSAYGVILSFYLSDHTFPNTTALDYAFVGGLSIGMAMLVSPLATYMMHHLGMQPVLILGTILETTSLITTSFVRANWQLFLSQGICFGIGMGLCFIGSVGVVSHWFEKRRSLVNGITAGGSGIGGLTYSLAVNEMISRFGYPWAMRSLGIICFVVNVVCGLLLRLPHRSQPKAGQSVMRLAVFRNPEYVTCIAWGVFSILGYIVLLFSLSSYSVAVGLTQRQGSIVSAVFNLGQGFGRPLVGILSDIYGRVDVAFVATMLTGIFSLVIWIFAKSMGLMCFFAVIVGFVAGTVLATAVPICAEIVGLAELHGALGFFWLAVAPPMAVAEAIAIQLRDETGEARPYLRVQLFAGFMYIGAGLCLALLRALTLLKERQRRRESGEEPGSIWQELQLLKKRGGVARKH